VVKMRLKHPTCCIRRGTFCIQVSYSNNSAISPTESSATSYYRTPKIDHTWNFLRTANLLFFLLNNFTDYFIKVIKNKRKIGSRNLTEALELALV